MNKVERFLEAYKKNVGKWTCSLHTSESNQPAAVFREVMKKGSSDITRDGAVVERE